jgi:hypothetical protein
MSLPHKLPSELLTLSESSNRRLALAATKEIARRTTSGTLDQRVSFLNAMVAHKCHQMRAAELNKRLNHINQMISTINQISKE